MERIVFTSREYKNRFSIVEVTRQQYDLIVEGFFPFSVILSPEQFSRLSGFLGACFELA